MTAKLAQWAEAVHGLYAEAKAFAHPKEKQRRAAQQAWEQRLLAIGRPFLDDRAAAQAKLCRRIERHIKELLYSWANRRRRRTTTPPSAACATWSSAARSAEAPDQRKGPTPR